VHPQNSTTIAGTITNLQDAGGDHREGLYWSTDAAMEKSRPIYYNCGNPGFCLCHYLLISWFLLYRSFGGSRPAGTHLLGYRILSILVPIWKSIAPRQNVAQLQTNGAKHHARQRTELENAGHLTQSASEKICITLSARTSKAVNGHMTDHLWLLYHTRPQQSNLPNPFSDSSPIVHRPISQATHPQVHVPGVFQCLFRPKTLVYFVIQFRPGLCHAPIKLSSNGIFGLLSITVFLFFPLRCTKPCLFQRPEKRLFFLCRREP
jgi:hypothetical protein